MVFYPCFIDKRIKVRKGEDRWQQVSEMEPYRLLGIGLNFTVPWPYVIRIGHYTL